MIIKQLRLTQLFVSGADDPSFWWDRSHGTRITLHHYQSWLSLLRRESGVADFWKSSSHLSLRCFLAELEKVRMWGTPAGGTYCFFGMLKVCLLDHHNTGNFSKRDEGSTWVLTPSESARHCHKPGGQVAMTPSLSKEDALTCCASEAFAESLSSLSPFPDLEAVVSRAKQIWWTGVSPM